MRVRVVSSHSLGGGVDVREGDLLDIPESQARAKLHLGLVVVVSDNEGVPDSPAPDTAASPQHPEIGDEAMSRDPQPITTRPSRVRKEKRK